MASDGYMPLPALLTHMKQKPSEQEVRSVVSCDAKVHTLPFTLCPHSTAKARSTREIAPMPLHLQCSAEKVYD